MRIGAIGSIGSQVYQPYIYNTNTLSGNSLSKINPIGHDLLSSKTDFSGMTEEQETLNPLKRGETSNFADVLAMQMQMGRMNADRIMKPAEEAVMPAAAGADDAGAEAVQLFQADTTLYQMQHAAMAYQVNMIA